MHIQHCDIVDCSQPCEFSNLRSVPAAAELGKITATRLFFSAAKSILQLMYISACTDRSSSLDAVPAQAVVLQWVGCSSLTGRSSECVRFSRVSGFVGRMPIFAGETSREHNRADRGIDGFFSYSCIGVVNVIQAFVTNPAKWKNYRWRTVDDAVHCRCNQLRE